jgi:arylsulfatase A-like enzyme
MKPAGGWGRLATLAVAGLIVISILALCGLRSGAASDRDASSVILIIIDTVRADHLGCYGHERATSPNIDAFSKECVLFRNAISPAPWTTPAIASMFTGQFPRVLGYDAEAVVVDDKVLCMAEIFRNKGYATAGVISHIFVSAELGFDQGFDSFDEENAQGHGHISSPSVTDKGIAFVNAHKDEKFFLFLHYFDPHCDYILHEQYDFFPDYDGDLYSGQPIADLREAARHMTAEDRRYLNALYDSEIRFTDEHIGRLFRHLKDIGIYEDLAIVVAADHGEAFLERGDDWIGHTKDVYQELIHVPFMIRLPGKGDGRSVDEGVSLLDFMPTVVAASGLDVPEGYEHDAVNLLGDGPEAAREFVFSETGRWGKQQTLISGDWKVTNDQIAGNTFLFDLASDPGELRDVAGENEEAFRLLRAKLFELDYDLRMSRSRFRVRAPKLSPQQVEKLKSLGYIR